MSKSSTETIIAALHIVGNLLDGQGATEECAAVLEAATRLEELSQTKTLRDELANSFYKKILSGLFRDMFDMHGSFDEARKHSVDLEAMAWQIAYTRTDAMLKARAE